MDPFDLRLWPGFADAVIRLQLLLSSKLRLTHAGSIRGTLSLCLWKAKPMMAINLLPMLPKRGPGMRWHAKIGPLMNL